MLLVFLLSLGGSVTSVKAADVVTFTGTELLGRPTSDSITVKIVPDSNIEYHYQYGTTSGSYDYQTDNYTATGGEPHEIVINGLTPDTQYYYRMQYHAPGDAMDDWVNRSEHSFWTQRAEGSTFTFDITTDSHIDILLGNESTWTDTMDNVASDNPDFLIDLGDTFAMDGNVNVAVGDVDAAEQVYEDQLPFFNMASASSAIYIVPGNHEQQEAWHLTASNTGGDPTVSLPVMSKDAEKKFFLNPVNDGFYRGDASTYPYLSGDQLKQDYYAWTWGDALFVVISPFWTTTTKPYTTTVGGGETDTTGSGDRWDWTLGLDQFDWLKTTLQESDAKYKFVFSHQIVGGNGMSNQVNYGHGGVDSADFVEWGGYDVNGTTWEWSTERPGWGSQPIRQMMEANGVTAYFHGHDHQFAHESLNGMVYQAVPSGSFGGSFGIYTTGGNSGNTIWADSNQGPGHVRVTVGPSETTVDFVRSNGTTAYSYDMAPTGGPTHDLTVDVDPGDAGVTTPEVGTHSYVEGSIATITATPAYGYIFDHWSGDCTGSDTCQVTMDGDKSVTAHFDIAPPGAVTYIGDIGSATAKTSGDTLVINTTAPVVTGDDIIIAFGSDPNQNISPITVTDSAGNTYQEVGYAVNTGQLRSYILAAYDVNPLPAGSDITITASASVTARAAVVSVFRGLADEDPLDQTSTGSGSSAVPSSGVTATTAEADELLIGAIGTEGPDGDAAGTWGNSFMAGPRLGTTGGTDDTNITVSLGFRVVSAKGAYSAEKSGVTSRDWAAMIATFKAESDPTAPQIVTTGTPLSAFSALPGTPSAEQSYTVSGINLTDDIVITPPADFEISLSSGSGWVSNPASISLTPTGGTVSSTPVYVRFSRATEGTSSGNITHTSADATTRNVAVTGTAAPLAPVDFSILLGRPTDHSVTANIIADTNAEFYIEYGTASGAYPDQTSTITATADEPIELVIDSLSENEEYFYRIVYRQVGTTDWNSGAEHSFDTQRAPGSTFTFTIASDSHLGQYGGQTADEYALYEQTLQNILADQPDFHIDDGDTFAMDPLPPYGDGLGNGMTEENAEAAYYLQRPYLDAISASVPVYLAIGNHENEEGWNWDDVFPPPEQSLAIVGLRARKMYFPNPVPDGFYTGNADTLPAEFVAAYPALSAADPYHEDYFAWTWGDALFVVLDPYHYSMTWPNDEGTGYGGEGQDGEESGDRWDWSLGIDQYLWLKETLETSDATYKFVFSHQVTGGTTQYGRGGISAAPYFEWGGQNLDGTWGWDTERPAAEGWTVPIHQLFVDNGVDAYIHGHDHIYAREELDGIVYLEVPKPDDAGYDWEPYGYGYNEDLYPDAIEMLPNSGHIRVTVSPAEATFEYVRSYLPGDGTNGIVADSVTIPGVTGPQYTITATAGANGSITPSGDVMVNEGADQTFTITPEDGYHVLNVIVDGTPMGPMPSYTFANVDDDHTIAATFAIDTFTITASAGTGGSIDPSGAVSVDYGAGQTFTITPEDGYQVADVSVDGVSEGAITSYEFTNVQANHTIAATFVEDNGILGDVNGDNFVNSTDALIVLSCDAGLDTTRFCPMNCGDANGDGFVNSTDALIILTYDAGLTVPFPMGGPGCPTSVTPPPGCNP